MKTLSREIRANQLSCPSILLVTPWYGGNYNGVGLVVEGITQSLCELGVMCVVLQVVGDGWLPRVRYGTRGELIVSVCVRQGSPDASLVSRFAARIRSILATLTVRCVVRLYGLQVAHFHYSMAEYGILSQVCRSAGLHQVTTFHGSDLLVNMDDKPIKDATVTMLQNCRVVTTVSHSLSHVLIERFPDAARVARTVHNAIPTEFFRHVPATLSGPRDIDILFVGNLISRKGVDVLIAAVKRVHDLVPSLRVVIVGDGAERQALIDLVKQFKLECAVDFVGRRDREDLVRLYCRARVLAVPSIAEPFGLVVVEGQVCGAAVVASAVGGIPEIIDDGATGFLVPPNNPQVLAATIIRVLGDDDATQSVTSRARSHALSTFSPARIALRYRDVYLAAAPPRSGSAISHSTLPVE